MTALHALAVSILAAAVPAFAAPPAPFATGDAVAGQALAERDCVSCHAGKFGSADAVYTRAVRRVQTPRQLLAQVQVCNVELGKGYFPEDEDNVAAYLNRDFYKFAP